MSLLASQTFIDNFFQLITISYCYRILSTFEATSAKIFLILSIVGHFSLFPLLFSPSVLLVKLLIFLLYTLYSFHSLYRMYSPSICGYSLPLLNPLESLYLIGLSVIFIYENVIHSLMGLSQSLPFMPLLLTSLYCSIGVTYCWIYYFMYFLQCTDTNLHQKKIFLTKKIK